MPPDYSGQNLRGRSFKGLNLEEAKPQPSPLSERYLLRLVNCSNNEKMHSTRQAYIPRTILVLAANPINQARLRLDEEIREIDEGLRRSKRRDCFKLEQRWAVGTDALRRALLDFEPHIVHFCGHGADEEGLILEDEAGQAKFVSTEALGNLFELCKEHVECVVLNACYSEKQANAIAHHIGYVIGMNETIGDRAAIKFAVGFYDALGAGRSVDDAHKFGCNAIQMQNIPQYLIPILKKNPDAAFTYTEKAFQRQQHPLISRIVYVLKYEWSKEFLIIYIIIFIGSFISWGAFPFSDTDTFISINAWYGFLNIHIFIFDIISVPNWLVPISVFFIPVLKWLNTSNILQVKPFVYTIIIFYGIFHICLMLFFLSRSGGKIHVGSIITLITLCFLLYRFKKII